MDGVGRIIKEGRFLQVSENLITTRAGSHPIRALPSYLNNKHGLALSAYVQALAQVSGEVGIGFHFIELFLNSGLYSAGTDHALFSSHDRLTVSYRLEHRSDFRIEAHAHTPSIDKDKVDANAKSLKQIKLDIDELRNAARHYRSGEFGDRHFDRLYEHFRFFCLNTFVQYLINPESHGFSTIGITSYFDKIIQFRDIRATIRHLCPNGTPSKELRAALSDVYVKEFGRNLDQLADPVKIAQFKGVAPSSPWGRCHTFLKSLREKADDFVIAILDTYTDMPVDCLKTFFVFATNVYLPWTLSATAGGLGSESQAVAARPHQSLPGALLKANGGKIFQPINYPSYRVYNVEAGRKPFTPSSRRGRSRRGETAASDDVFEKDFLGPMLVWPLLVPIEEGARREKAIFWASGFLRMMGRYDTSDGAPLDWDTYETDVFPDDVATLTEPVEALKSSISLMLATKSSQTRR